MYNPCIGLSPDKCLPLLLSYVGTIPCHIVREQTVSHSEGPEWTISVSAILTHAAYSESVLKVCSEYFYFQPKIHFMQ